MNCWLQLGVHGAVVARQVGFRHPARAANAFRDVVSGQFEMHAAEVGAAGFEDATGQLKLPEDLLKPAGLDAAFGRLGVAVHRITTPEHLLAPAADRFHDGGQALLHAVRPKPVNEGEPARFVLRVEHPSQRQGVIGSDGGADLDPDGISDAAKVFRCAPSSARVRSPIQGK